MQISFFFFFPFQRFSGFVSYFLFHKKIPGNVRFRIEIEILWCEELSWDVVTLMILECLFLLILRTRSFRNNPLFEIGSFFIYISNLQFMQRLVNILDKSNLYFVVYLFFSLWLLYGYRNAKRTKFMMKRTFRFSFQKYYDLSILGRKKKFPDAFK